MSTTTSRLSLCSHRRQTVGDAAFCGRLTPSAHRLATVATVLRQSLAVVACLFITRLSMAAEVTGDQPPDGYHLVAEDNCGTEDQTHVVAGTSWLYPIDMVEAAGEHRAIVFDNQVCVFWYLNPNPKASYKVDVIYVDNGGRVQRLEANGHQLHDRMELPVRRPRRFLFDVPKAAYAKGEKLELKFIRVAGANAIVSYVRVWSTDPTPLGAPAAEDRAAYRPPPPPPPRQPMPLWQLDDPVQRDWLLQDELALRPLDEGWETPAAVVQSRVVPAVEKHLERGRAIAADLRLDGVELDEDLEALAEIRRKRDILVKEGSFSPEAWNVVYCGVRQVARQMALKHPQLHEAEGLLFVRRHHAHFNHQCARRRSRYSRLGGEICLLKEVRAEMDGPVVSLTEDKFPEGLFGRPELSFDAKRIVFGFAAAEITDLDEPIAETLAGQDSIGNGTHFQVWEMALDGRSPARSVTRGTSRREESTDPIYLPDGRIAFMSPRAGGMVQCGDWAWADCMFTVNADGSGLRQITRAKEGEWDPSLMDDGSIMFTRWEYVMRFWRPTQLIWGVRPDGTYPRVLGGYLTGERNYARCRQIPGTSKLVCVESHHHNDGSGNILVVDLRYGRDTARGERRIVPGACDCPYPIDENYFLISHDPRGTGAIDRRTAGQMGIYLADVHGGLELIYRDAELSAMYPTLVRSRPVPPQTPPIPHQMQEPFGQFVVQDVYRGLPESMRGKARHLRIVEAHERHVHTSPCNIWVGMGGFETKTVLGCVPIEPDGSAYFRLPARKAVFFSVLDEDYRALHTMRMTTYVKPGETTGCVGCHEPMARAPIIGAGMQAARREASRIEPPPWGVQAFGFPKLVQPILDAHCTRCHDGAEGTEAQRKSFDLTAGSSQGESFTPNIWTAYANDYEKHYTFRSYWKLLPHVAYTDIHQYHTPPGSWGSRVSPLVKLLAKGHEEVTLSPAQWRTLCAWIDCNVPYLDDYRKFAVDPKIRQASAAEAAR